MSQTLHVFKEFTLDFKVMLRFLKIGSNARLRDLSFKRGESNNTLKDAEVQL